MYFYYKNGCVKMVSSEQIKTDLPYVKYIPTKKEKEYIRLNYKMHCVDNEIIFNKPKHVIKQEHKEAIRKIKNKKRNGEKLTIHDMYDMLVTML